MLIAEELSWTSLLSGQPPKNMTTFNKNYENVQQVWCQQKMQDTKTHDNKSDQENCLWTRHSRSPLRRTLCDGAWPDARSRLRPSVPPSPIIAETVRTKQEMKIRAVGQQLFVGIACVCCDGVGLIHSLELTRCLPKNLSEGCQPRQFHPGHSVMSASNWKFKTQSIKQDRRWVLICREL